MADIFLFTSRAEIDAEENLVNFIDLSRNKLAVFGSALPFDNDAWDITEHVAAKAKRNRVRIFFSDWETANDPVSHSMPEPFLSFSKAYIRYRQGFKPVANPNARLAPLRALCFALHEVKKTSPTEIDGHILNRAAQLLEERFSAKGAYKLGRNLQNISEFLDENRLVRVGLNWKNHIKRPSDTERVGKIFDDRRKDKLPSPVDLDAVAEAYRLAVEPGDVIITSIAAIMCATPDRISEILTLRENCEHYDRLPDGREVYGLRYWPAKDGDPMIKYVIPSMTDLLKDAICRIKKHTESARELARWYESNPGRLYLPEYLEGVRGENLTLQQLSIILYHSPGFEEEASAWLYYRKFRQPLAKLKEFGVPYSLVEQLVIDSLPENFPFLDMETGLRYSEALCVVHPYTFNRQKRVLLYNFESITHGNVSDALGGRIDHKVPSIFSRFGISGFEEQPIKINTHKFRHYLNTLALHGGLSDLDIAKWSGRKDVRQNRAYDHVSAKDKLIAIRESIGDHSKMFGPLGYLPNVPSISRDEFANLKVMSAHTTEFGYCIHDYTSTPCQKYLDCLNCNELVCIKGDHVREANIRRQLEETRDLLAAARKGVEEGAYGANRWVQHQTQTLQRLEELSGILENPLIETGAVIQLKHLKSASRLSQAAEALGMDLSETSNSIDVVELLTSANVIANQNRDTEQ